MQFQMIFLVAFGVATSAAPLVSVFADKCGNSDPTRACLVGINQLGHNVGFTVAIGQNNNNVDQVLGKGDNALLLMRKLGESDMLMYHSLSEPELFYYWP